MALPGGGVADDGAMDAEEQLTLADAEERLPWLESDDDYEQPGVDTGRIVSFAAVGLLVIAVLLGALYYFTREQRDAAAVADGSVIEAPDTPYKTRPTDPGGRQVEGTGDKSYEVAEGERVEGQIDAGVPAPSIDRVQAGAPAGASTTAPTPAAASAPVRGIGIQIGAYSNRAQAEDGWNTLSTRFEVLKGRSHRVLEGTADSGTIYRLQAVAGSAAEADTLCRSIKAAGGDCQVKR